MKKLTLIALLLSATVAMAQTKQTITKATVTYQIKNMGFTTLGFLSGFAGEVKFDKAHLVASSIEASVETKTINSDDDARDAHLRKEDFFDVDHYPKMIMKSVSFKQKGSNNYIGQFELTIKGKTKLVEVPFVYAQTGTTGSFKGSFKINRLDFGIGDSSLVLSNEVTISVGLETAIPAS
ncbi:YceI family protein [Mucilaginibacter sp. HMF5004]|uniref:YceI family protein n=1 Tax=Mucilaginibacter rivuli TaxID=2857527 RepID=UPI001C5F95B6|nr:YceI family protein [Mucilaginibacter rivuli]MBW4890046.1 YceI family protein [Mucilaginibacter rivuli]